MTDNLKLKKADSKRFALGQKHERNYIRKITSKLIGLCETDIKYSVRKSGVKTFFMKDIGFNYMTTSSILKIAKALIKCLDKIEKDMKKKRY